MAYIPANHSLPAPTPAAPPAAPALPAPALVQCVEALPEAPAATSADLFPRARQVAFLRALAESGAVRPASAAIGISYRTVYRERRANPAFRRAWDSALLAARALHEDVLACRAIDGVEEVVWFHGQEVGRRVRYDTRLLLAHLARLDKLTEDARLSAFADDYEGALERFAAGQDDPAPLCTGCGEALPAPVAEPGATVDTAPAGEGASSSPGLCDKCDSAARKSMPQSAAPAPAASPCDDDEPDPCPDCGGWCLGDEEDLTEEDCQFMGNRVDRREDARPGGVLEPDAFPGGDPEGRIDMAQLLAFEAGVDAWWLVTAQIEGVEPRDWPKLAEAG